ncbi:MAG: DegT/DnrJ/EryC1/StrS family aminotransferase [Patescibacteria group bacterium]
MKLLDLKAQYDSIKPEIDQAMQRVVENSQFIMGADVEELEKSMAQFCQSQYAIGLNSGSDALLFALRAYEIKDGNEVIVPAYTFVSTAEVVALERAKPVFVDIDPQTFNIDPDQIEEKITDKTKAIIPVHLYGQAAEMDTIMQIAQKHNLKVIEDAAQAIGAEYKGKKVCSIGNIGCLSFFPAKNLGAYGDAGMVTTSDQKVAEWLQKARNHGQPQKYTHDFIGDSSRLDNLQAAILNVKMKYISDWNEQRRTKADNYNKLLADVTQITTPWVADHNIPVYQQYTIRVSEKRDQLQDFLKENDIPSAVHYPSSLPLQKAFKYLNHKDGEFPQSDRAASEILCLPIYPELADADQELIAQKIKEFFA